MRSVIVRGLLDPQAPHGPDVARDPARRRDDLGHVRADRPDQHGLRRHLRRPRNEKHRRRGHARRRASRPTTATSDYAALRRVRGRQVAGRARRGDGRARRSRRRASWCAATASCARRRAARRRSSSPSRRPTSPRFTVQEGALPAQSGEVAVLEDQAKDDDITRRRAAPARRRTPACTRSPSSASSSSATSSSIGGATVIVMTFADAQAWFDPRARRRSSNVARRRGRLARPSSRPRIQRRGAVRPQGADRPGAGATRTPSDIAEAINGSSTTPLLAFGVVAVFVGAFIIFNTFSITVAQRTREFGMLRTLGATRRQVLGAVLGEALVVGIIASILGFAARHPVRRRPHGAVRRRSASASRRPARRSSRAPSSGRSPWASA